LRERFCSFLEWCCQLGTFIVLSCSVCMYNTRLLGSRQG
jgi:hypothetical protein